MDSIGCWVILAAAFGALGVLALSVVAIFVVELRPWASRRHDTRRCERCGYDLRATPPRSPCPECGAVWRPLA